MKRQKKMQVAVVAGAGWVPLGGRIVSSSLKKATGGIQNRLFCKKRGRKNKETCAHLRFPTVRSISSLVHFVLSFFGKSHRRDSH